MDIVVGKAYLKATSEYYCIVKYVGPSIVVYDYFDLNNVKIRETYLTPDSFKTNYPRTFRIAKKKYLYADGADNVSVLFLSSEKIENLDSWCKYLGEIPDYLGDD